MYDIDEVTGAAGREEEGVPEDLPLGGDGDQLVLKVELPTLSLVAGPVTVAALRVLAFSYLDDLNITSTHSAIIIIIIIILTCLYSGLESSEFKMYLHCCFLFLPALGTMKDSWVSQAGWEERKCLG